MIKFGSPEVFGLYQAILGIRNSWNSQHKSDSTQTYIGEEDLKLALKLNKAGASHAKYLRQIPVIVNITAPLYWWKQFDQYKVGVVTNSESTMHTINRTGFLHENGYLEVDIFSFDYGTINNLGVDEQEQFYGLVSLLEKLRKTYNETKDKRYWDLLIALLPSGFNQMRTTTMNYAVLANIYHDRKSHKLDEWKEMCKWIETLPYSELITGERN